MMAESDGKNIPTKKVSIGKGENKKEIELYQWLTYEEDKERQNILYKNVKVNPGEKGEDAKFDLTTDDLYSAQIHLIKSLCKNVTYEDFIMWSPSLRQELIDAVTKVHDESKKK